MSSSATLTHVLPIHHDQAPPDFAPPPPPPIIDLSIMDGGAGGGHEGHRGSGLWPVAIIIAFLLMVLMVVSASESFGLAVFFWMLFGALVIILMILGRKTGRETGPTENLKPAEEERPVQITMVRCRYCGSLNTGTSTKCSSCGATL